MRMKKRTLILSASVVLVVLLAAFLAAYRFIGVGGRVLQIAADPQKGFDTEYKLFLPDTLQSSDTVFLLVEPNNTGRADDSHQAHVDAAHDIVRFGQPNRIARELGVPLLVPCFDRPKTTWKRYTHALDRDTLSSQDSPRIDQQLLAMIADARTVLAKRQIKTQEQVLLNGFSASGSFVNRFTALYPDRVAGTAAGGINSMTILPAVRLQGQELIYPVGVADLLELTGSAFQPQAFAAVPQYYYMGADDENDALQFDDAYSDEERTIVRSVLGEQMNERWKTCERLYSEQGVQAQFHTYPGIGHETTAAINADLVSFFRRIIEEKK